MTRPPWEDEIFTLLLVGDPSWRHFTSALAHGIDTHPPMLHLLLRSFAAVTGHGDFVSLRLACAALGGLAMLGVYLLAREVGTVWQAIAAALIVWAQPLAIHSAFEVRFYAGFLAASAWFAYLLVRSRNGGGFTTRLALAIVSVALCTIHYFGVLSLSLILAGDWLANRPSWLVIRKAYLPAIAGFAALALCGPLLQSQRHAISVATWIPRPHRRDILPFLRLFLPIKILGPLALASAGALLWSKSKGRAFSIRSILTANRDLAGLLSLALLPAILVGTSFLWQPMMAARYAIAALAALAPIVVVLLAVMPGWMRIASCAGLAVAVGFSTIAEARQDRAFARRTESLASTLRALPADAPMLFAGSHELMPLAWVHPEFRGRLFLLDFELPAAPLAPTQPFPADDAIFDRDISRLESSYYDMPRLKRESDVLSLERFIWISNVRRIGYGDTCDRIDALFQSRSGADPSSTLYWRADRRALDFINSSRHPTRR